MTTIERLAERDRQDTLAFAKRFGLSVDWERGLEGKKLNDSLRIPGRRGELYFDAGKLCLMALNTRVAGMSTEAIQDLGGKCWTGDVWRDERRRGFRDVRVEGIPEENWRRAIRLCRIRTRRILSEEEKASLHARLNFQKPPENPPIGNAL